MTFRNATVLAITLALSALGANWLEVPFVRQVDAGCGSAAIAMVMQYWVRHDQTVDARLADASEIQNDLAASATRKGISGETLRSYLLKHGFDVYIINGEMQDLRAHLARGRPIIVCIGPRGPKAPLHYAVAVGIEDDAIVLNDPARGPVFRESLPEFFTSWKLTANWMMLAVPRQGA